MVGLKWLSSYLFLVALCVVLVVGAFVGAVTLHNSFNDYWRDGAPDGWYHQREGIGGYQIGDNGSSVFFALCDHGYLGPLHGTFKVASDVTFLAGNHRYDLLLKDNVIVQAVPYD